MAARPELPDVRAQGGAGAADGQPVPGGERGEARAGSVPGTGAGMRLVAPGLAVLLSWLTAVAFDGGGDRGVGSDDGTGPYRRNGESRTESTSQRNRFVVTRLCILGMTTDPGTPRRAPAGAAVLREDVTEAIRAAVFEELAAVGFARMSIEGIARRAGVGKTAVYRRWKSKLSPGAGPGLGVAAQGLPAPATGSLYGDVRPLLEVAVARPAPPGRLAGHPGPAGRGGPQPGDRRRDQGGAAGQPAGRGRGGRTRRRWPAASCRRARDPDRALDLIVGPLYWRLVVVRGGAAEGVPGRAGGGGGGGAQGAEVRRRARGAPRRGTARRSAPPPHPRRPPPYPLTSPRPPSPRTRTAAGTRRTRPAGSPSR